MDEEAKPQRWKMSCPRFRVQSMAASALEPQFSNNPNTALSAPRLADLIATLAGCSPFT